MPIRAGHELFDLMDSTNTSMGRVLQNKIEGRRMRMRTKDENEQNTGGTKAGTALTQEITRKVHI